MTPRLARMAAAVVLIAPTLVLVASPARAAPPGLQRVVGQPSATNSANPKSSVATCPPNTQVIGTGAQITGGHGQVVLDDLVPNQALTTVTATGREDDDGFSGNWSVTAIAVCAQPPAFLERVPFTIGPDSDTKTVFGECPGTQVIGVGFEIVGGLGQVTIEGLSRAPHVTAIEDQDGTLANWSLTLYAICGSAVPGQHEVNKGTGFDSDGKSISASCDTHRVLSPAVALVQGRGQVVITEILPNAALTSVRVAAEEDQDGQPGVWSLRSFALCAP